MAMRDLDGGLMKGSRWERGLRSSSGMISGVVMRCCPKVFPNYLPWRSIGTQRSMKELFHMLRDLRISSEEDSVLWKGGGHGSFRIKDAYKLFVLLVPSSS
ncbi:hypothetical protein CK203_002123 [Vitis vinifera]|uniref:Uncharacterized protein n=1 Tax=Vitis vinifera TaxID=29760 RepID=A0A438KK69_VITVI|nr:hypothetical protein CK203_002123 [Vitis vinifera]